MIILGFHNVNNFLYDAQSCFSSICTVHSAVYLISSVNYPYLRLLRYDFAITSAVKITHRHIP